MLGLAVGPALPAIRSLAGAETVRVIRVRAGRTGMGRPEFGNLNVTVVSESGRGALGRPEFRPNFRDVPKWPKWQ